ncbi:MAG: hypothetical protein ACK5NG_10870 [Chthoniobacterales bacterium]
MSQPRTSNQRVTPHHFDFEKNPQHSGARHFSKIKTSLLFFSLFGFWIIALLPASAQERWWPHQAAGRELVVIDSHSLKRPEAEKKPEREHGPPLLMLAESLSGLAARAVNEGRGDQLLWIAPGEEEPYNEWRQRLIRRTGMQEVQTNDIWQLVKNFQEKDIVKGYVLFRAEDTGREERLALEEEGKAEAAPMNESCNVATVMAGLLNGVLIEESLEAKAKAAGLSLLFDARDKTEKEVFEKNQKALNRHATLVQAPDMPFGRDLAIAHRMMVSYGTDSPTPEIYEWMEPIGTVFGWNSGDEREAVMQATVAGHIFIPADWAANLPALSAGAPKNLSEVKMAKFRRPKPSASKASDRNVSLVMSDGDNLQWLLTTFTHNPFYWGNPRRNETPIAWGMPVADLIQMAPDIYDYLVETQGDQTSILCHLGYYYPDNFGDLRSSEERKQLLKELGERAEWTFQASGTHYLTFLVNEINSGGATQAYQIFANQAPSMEGMFAIAYHPYEDGGGKVEWVEQKSGQSIPVTTAAYALWKTDSNERPRAGNPGKLAEIIDAMAAPKKPEWVILHVWSDFVEGETSKAREKVRGVTPTLKFAEELSGHGVGVITLEELVEQLEE